MFNKLPEAKPEAVGSGSRNCMPVTNGTETGRAFALCPVAAPSISSCRGTEDTAVSVKKGAPLFFEVGSPFAETGSTCPLAVGEPLRSAPCLPRPCRVQGVCMGSAQRIRNPQGTLRAGVVDGCPIRSRTPLPPAREFEACAQLPSSFVSVGVGFHLHCYFAVKREGVKPGSHTLCLW